MGRRASQRTAAPRWSPRSARRSRSPLRHGYLRQVIFMTDGAVADETPAVRHHQERARATRACSRSASARRRTRTSCARPRSSAAARTRTSAARADVEARCASCSRSSSASRSPTCSSTGRRPSELYPPRCRTCTRASRSFVAASFPARDGPLALTAFGRVAGAPWKQTVGRPVDATRHRDAVGAAQDRVLARQPRRRRERRPDPQDVLDVALEHHLVSPYTSLVAVDKTPARSSCAALRSAERRAT